MNLDEWNSVYGSDDQFVKPQSNRYEFEMDKTYVTRAREARAVTSSFGSRQIELKLEVIVGDEVVGNVTEWVALPKQPETDSKLTRDQVARLTLRRRDDLRTLMACVDPDTYSVPADVRGPAWEKCALEINKKVMAYADELHKDIEQDGSTPLPHFSDVTFYLVKRPNKNKPEYPYTNWFSVPKKGVALYTGGNDSDIPF